MRGDGKRAKSGQRGEGMESLRKLGKEAGRSKPGDAADGPGKGRHYRRSARRRSRAAGARRWPRRTLLVATLLTFLTLIGAGGAYGYVQWRLGQIKRIPIVGLQPEGHSTQSTSVGSSVPAFTMLVIGSDSRDLGAGGASQFGNSTEVAGQRSDSIILVRVAPKTRSLALLSIPRDTLVPIPCYGTTRINTAFNSGTPSLLVQVLDQDFGIQVNHVAVFNFDTFRAVADAVGGVEQYFPSPAKDDFSLLSIPAAGCYNLTGNQALAFVRSREYEYEINGTWQYQLYPESDLARIQRQQSFFRDLVKKAKQVAPTNPIALNAVISGVTKNLTLDKGFSNSLILSLAQDFHSANLSTLPSYTYPTVNSTAVPGALDPETQQGQAVIQQWLDVGQTAAAPSKSPSKSPKPVITVNPASVRIEVENGSGIGNQAGTAGQDLASLGYRATVSGDAPNFGLATTEIEYAPDSLAAAKQVQSQLVGGATLIEDSALTPTIYNLDVVTGQSFQGVIGSSTSATPPAPTTTVVASPAYVGTQTVNPDSSSVYDGVYIPPGLQPGQIPQTCGE
jgi:polyisoprenyl-teichoic acid--peptidoglycan teichoic acid transferase